jgi:pimeloyl-ACP methyl ester carboxylesterase
MSQNPPALATQFATSADGTRIAYDASGSGPVVMLLHGGGQTRRVWHEQGYVERLAREFTVITVDFRGNGDSDKPSTKAAYAVERLVEDLVAVADKAGTARFTVWGFSYGANIGRYLATSSVGLKRVQAMVYIGIPFGPPVDPQFRDLILARLRDPATPPVSAAWTGALLDYPPVEPSDLKCPTLWVVGTANTPAYDSARRYRERLDGTPVELVTFDGLTHPQEQSRIDDVLPREIAFTRAHAGRSAKP